jgi:excisionase family DNA binding protein
MSIQSTGLGDDEIGSLVVSPKRACALLDCSRPTLYGMINSRELESYKDGTSRKITVRSIKQRIERKLAEASSMGEQSIGGRDG